MNQTITEKLNTLRQEHIVKHLQNLTELEQYSMVRLYMPAPEPHLHGVRTALCRTLNRTQPNVDRTYLNPVY